MALKVGEPAPDFKLASAAGEKQGEFELSAQRGKNVVIFFYALDFTPVWKDELSAIQANLAKFADLNAQVVGVNTDSVPSHIAFQKSLGGLTYALASDRWPYAAIAQAYGIFPASKHPVPFINDRAVFIVDKSGKIAWSKIYELKQQPDLAEIFAAIKKLP
jgi:peroxiredoxin